MDEQIILIYCLCDDLLKAMHHREDPQCQMSDAEVMTTALVAALFFRGNQEQARHLLGAPRYIPHMLSKSRFNRRLHRIKPFFLTLFQWLATTWKELNTEAIYAIDTFPVSVCDNIRISHARLYQDEAYRGYIPSKRRYFYGLKVHLMVTQRGQPVEFFLTPGSYSDVTGLMDFDFNLPPGAKVFADKAYNAYHFEDELKDLAQIELLPMRKQKSRRSQPPYMRFLQFTYRKIVETTASLVERLLPKSIHAVTALGFELKVVLFVLACSISYIV